jgi:hypothetical protein
VKQVEIFLVTGHVIGGRLRLSERPVSIGEIDELVVDEVSGATLSVTSVVRMRAH